MEVTNLTASRPPRKSSLIGKLRFASEATTQQISVDSESNNKTISSTKQNENIVTAQLTLPANMEPESSRKAPLKDDERRVRKSSSTVSYLSSSSSSVDSKKEKKEKKEKKDKKEKKKDKKDIVDSNRFQDVPRGSIELDDGSRDSIQYEDYHITRKASDEKDESILPSSSKRILQTFLSDFDNQSIWDDEIKRIESVKKDQPKTGSLKEQKKKGDKPYSFFFRSPKKKESAEASAASRIRGQTMSDNYSPILRSRSERQISNKVPVNVEYSSPLAPLHWPPGEREKYKGDMVKRYEDQQRLQQERFEKERKELLQRSAPVVPFQPSPPIAIKNSRNKPDPIQDKHSPSVSPASASPIKETKKIVPNIKRPAQKEKSRTISCPPPPPPVLITKQRAISIPVNPLQLLYYESRARNSFKRGQKYSAGPKFIDDLLSDNMLQRIFGLLGFGDLCRVSQVCSRWNTVSSNPKLWLSVYQYYLDQLPPVAGDKNIWQDPGVPSIELVPKPEDAQYNDMTLNQLVARLTPHSTVPNKGDLDTFLLTYKTFTSPLKLLRKLIQRYQVPEREFPSQADKENFNKMIMKPIQFRVCNIIKLLIEQHFQDFPDEAVLLLQIFVRGLPKSDRSYQTLSFLMLKKLRPRKLSNPRKLSSAGRDILSRSIPVLFDRMNDKFSILDYKSRVIAEQLSLIEYEYFKSIKPGDFLDEMNSKSKENATAMRSMIDHFNDVSRWVEETILKEDRCIQRARLVEKFIHIAKELRDMNNFETLTAVISPLYSTAVSRLKYTLEEVNLKDSKLMEDLHTLMSADKSYKNYRETIKDIAPPCILYLGILIRDLIYIDDTGATDLAKGHINFGKKKSVKTVLDFVQKCQTKSYDFEIHPALHNRLQLLPQRPKDKLSQEQYMKQLFDLSLQREPRNCKKSDVV